MIELSFSHLIVDVVLVYVTAVHEQLYEFSYSIDKNGFELATLVLRVYIISKRDFPAKRKTTELSVRVVINNGCNNSKNGDGYDEEINT